MDYTVHPGQNTRVGSLSLLQGILPAQGLNPSLPALQVDSLPAEPQGKPSLKLFILVYIFVTVVFRKNHFEWETSI